MPVKVGWGEGGVSLSTVNASEGGVGRRGVSLSTVNASEGGVGRRGCFIEYGECQ